MKLSFNYLVFTYYYSLSSYLNKNKKWNHTIVFYFIKNYQFQILLKIVTFLLIKN